MTRKSARTDSELLKNDLNVWSKKRPQPSGSSLFPTSAERTYLSARPGLGCGSLGPSGFGPRSGSRLRFFGFFFFFVRGGGAHDCWGRLRNGRGLALRTRHLDDAAARHFTAELGVEVREETNQNQVLIRGIQWAEGGLGALLGFCLNHRGRKLGRNEATCRRRRRPLTPWFVACRCHDSGRRGLGSRHDFEHPAARQPRRRRWRRTASRGLLVVGYHCGCGLGGVGVARLLVVEDRGANVPRQTLACEKEKYSAGTSATAAVASHEAARFFDLLRLSEESEARLFAQVVYDSFDLRERTFVCFPEGFSNCVDSLITSHG